jgi:hypothetical protein
MKRCIAQTLTVGLLLLTATTQAAETDDLRQAVDMPDRMKSHMRANMRDHLLAITEIQSVLAAGRYDQAAAIAEQRLGMTSLEAHGARHVAGFMPEGMRAVGTAMHQAASRFARVAQEVAVTGDLSGALGGSSSFAKKARGAGSVESRRSPLVDAAYQFRPRLSSGASLAQQFSMPARIVRI